MTRPCWPWPPLAYLTMSAGPNATLEPTVIALVRSDWEGVAIGRSRQTIRTGRPNHPVSESSPRVLALLFRKVQFLERR